ncbi:MAG: glycosyltransferase, partial [Patescibacteria group bacterium]|nr:glycosyltransferase [Patescibacteria group bacterium]
MSRKRKVILPKISIIIPSYNKSKYLTYTLQSIIDQKYPNLEVLIQDGGSTDGSVEIIKKFAKSNRKIIKWVSKKDDGQVKAINQGLRKASGEVVTFINADDVYKQ